MNNLIERNRDRKNCLAKQSYCLRRCYKLAGKMFLMLLFVIGNIACGGSDDDPVTPPSGEDGLVNIDPFRSLSLLSISADKGLVTGTYTASNLATFVQTQDPDVVALQDVDFRTTDTGGKDLISEIAYTSSKNGSPRQGIFTLLSRVNGGETGLGLIRRDCFEGTNREVLESVLVLHTMKYTFQSGTEIRIATCQFDRTNQEMMMKQASALTAYADTVQVPFLLAASIHATPESDVISTLSTKYRRSCKYTSDNTYPASSPANRYDYVLTPLKQDWGTQYVGVAGDATVSGHKGIIIRVGLK